VSERPLRKAKFGCKAGQEASTDNLVMSKAFLFLGIAIVAEVLGTTAMKASEGFTKLVPSIATVLAYGTAFYFLSQVLSTIPVGIAYAIWSGVGIVLISLLGWFVYKQALDAPAVIGMGLIIAGVVVINVFSKASAH
jgi:small multidrug resistance pump